MITARHTKGWKGQGNETYKHMPQEVIKTKNMIKQESYNVPWKEYGSAMDFSCSICPIQSCVWDTCLTQDSIL